MEVWENDLLANKEHERVMSSKVDALEDAMTPMARMLITNGGDAASRQKCRWLATMVGECAKMLVTMAELKKERLYSVNVQFLDVAIRVFKEYFCSPPNELELFYNRVSTSYNSLKAILGRPVQSASLERVQHIVKTFVLCIDASPPIELARHEHFTKSHVVRALDELGSRFLSSHDLLQRIETNRAQLIDASKALYSGNFVFVGLSPSTGSTYYVQGNLESAISTVSLGEYRTCSIRSSAMHSLALDIPSFFLRAYSNYCRRALDHAKEQTIFIPHEFHHCEDLFLEIIEFIAHHKPAVAVQIPPEKLVQAKIIADFLGCARLSKILANDILQNHRNFMKSGEAWDIREIQRRGYAFQLISLDDYMLSVPGRKAQTLSIAPSGMFCVGTKQFDRLDNLLKNLGITAG
jgi:hypothetical protein